MARLQGIPVFMVDRVLTVIDHNTPSIYRGHWNIDFDNGYGASIVQFTNKEYSGGEDFELGVYDADRGLNYNTIIYSSDSSDVLRGDEVYIDKWLSMIEALSPCGQFFIWPRKELENATNAD